MKCPNCGADLPEDSRFCFDCGSAIAPPPPPLSYPPPPPPPAHRQPAQQPSPLPTPTYSPPPPPPEYRPTPPPLRQTPRPPRKKTGLFLGIGAVVLVSCLVIVGVGAGGLYYGFLPTIQAIFPTRLPSPDIGQVQPAGGLEVTMTPWPVPTLTSIPTFTTVPTPTTRVERYCSNGSLLLADDFTHASPLGRPFYNNKYMLYSQDQQSGILQSTTQAADSLLPILYPDVLAADFNLDFSAAPINMQQDSQYGVIFRVGVKEKNINPYYMLGIQPNSNKVVFGLWNDPNWTERAGFDLPQGLLGMGGGSQVRLEVLRDHFRLFVNDHYVTTFVSPTLADVGEIGLVLGASQSSATRAESVRFGNLAIYAPGLCP